MTAEGAFHYRDGELYCEQVPARAVAEQFGTPCYLYSAGELRERFRRHPGRLRRVVAGRLLLGQVLRATSPC